jgi:predicted nucleotidyltransferase component of viral defense system
MEKRHLTSEERREWADEAHFAFLNALVTQTSLDIGNIAFQGGTSLSLAWGSPRFSEDLDFLIQRGSPIDELVLHMPDIEKSLQRHFLATSSEFDVQIVDKTKDRNRMNIFEVQVQKQGVLGKVKVKTEFWGVDTSYLNGYASEYRLSKSLAKGRISSAPIPTASLESVLSDKLVALSFRPKLKWRDVFDIWWIQQNIERNPDYSLERVVENALHHQTAYEP